MDNLIVAAEAVVPLFCLMFIGVLVKKYRLLSDEELVHMNRMVFRVFFSIMMFYNIYTTDIATTFRPRLMLFGAGALLLVFLLAMVVVCRIEKTDRRRGAMIQAIFRSNFVLMGIPLVGNIFGDKELAVTTMMIAIIVPLYNILGVFTLETFRGHKFAFWPIFLGVLKNPMILGAITGAVFLLLGIPVVGLIVAIIWAAGALPVVRPSRLIEHLGLMSFAMFLTNEVTRIVWFGLFDAVGQANWSVGMRWGVWAVGLAAAFVGAAVFRYGFDRPVQAWLNPPGSTTPAPGVSRERPIA